MKNQNQTTLSEEKKKKKKQTNDLRVILPGWRLKLAEQNKCVWEKVKQMAETKIVMPSMESNLGQGPPTS